MTNELRSLIADVAKRDGRMVIVTVILMIMSSMFQGVTILMLVPMMSIMDVGEAGSLPFGLSRFLSFLFELPYGIRLLLLLSVFFTVMTFRAVLARIVKIRTMQLASGFTAGMREEYYDELMGKSLEQFSSENQSMHTDAMITQIPRLTTTINYFMSMMINAVTALIDLVIAFSLSASLSFFVLAVGGVFFLFFRKFTRRSAKIGERLTQKYEAFNAEVATQLSGFKEIKSYGISGDEALRFREVTEDFQDLMVEATRNVSAPRMISTIGEAILISIIFFCALFFLHIETSRMIAVLYVFYKLWPLLPATQEYIQGIRETVPAYKVIVDVRRKDAVSDGSGRQTVLPEAFYTNDKAEVINRIADETGSSDEDAAVTFDHVSFSYRGSSSETLRDISFTVAKNRITAITGPSGAGKSTVIDLICGFLNPTSGRICIRAGEREIAYVPQKPMILSASVRENIARFHPGIRDEEIVEALIKTEAMGFLEGKCLPGQSPLDLRMGDDGVMFSGGEVQRIVLARAAAGTPKMLILDEATSALDFENEKQIAQLLQKLSESMTILIIAHRVSTIQTADDILVIENGQLTEQGSAERLLGNPDSYLAKMKDG